MTVLQFRYNSDDERRRAAAEAMRRARQELAALADTGPPCTACRWYGGEKYVGPTMTTRGETFGLCANPALTYLEFDIVDGDVEEKITTIAGSARHPDGLCGPNGALWEARPTRWQRFLAWLARVFKVA